MSQRVCPWWMGYLLASPLRRITTDPASLVRAYVRDGMTVLEPGPGMGFFTLELARLVGDTGRVVTVDIQPKMLAGLERKLAKHALLSRVELRLAEPGSMGVKDLNQKVDFVFAFAVVHELPSASSFFAEAAAAMKQGGLLLVAEPAGHVNQGLFNSQLKFAANAGLEIAASPAIRGSRTALLRKSH
jgi:ubiquinone/menaquinone biosynthesis C-methylase UbiE